MSALKVLWEVGKRIADFPWVRQQYMPIRRRRHEINSRASTARRSPTALYSRRSGPGAAITACCAKGPYYEGNLFACRAGENCEPWTSASWAGWGPSGNATQRILWEGFLRLTLLSRGYGCRFTSAPGCIAAQTRRGLVRPALQARQQTGGTNPG